MKTNTLDFDAQALRERILDLAMRGKLVPQDPNDEPASVLVEKIKAEKEQLIKEKKIKKSKPLPPITDDEKPFDIPANWEWVRLGEVGNWAAGATPSRKHPEYYGGDIPWLKTGDLNDDIVEDTTEKITKLGVKNSSVKINNPGNVLIAMYGATIGKLGIVGKKALVTNQACCGCTPFNGIYNWYLFYYLFASRKRLIDLGSGGAQSNISKQKIENFSFPLPPLSEQSRIAARIAQLFALLRKVEYSTQQYAKLQTLLKSKVLDLAIRGKLVKQDPNDEPASVLLEKIKAEKQELIKEKKIKKTKPLPPITDDEKPFDIPDSWEWVRLGEIIELISGRDIAKKYHLSHTTDSSIPYITGASNIDNKENIVINEWIENPSVVVTKGTLLLSVKGTIGKIAILQLSKAHIARQIMGIENIYNLNQDFQKYFLESYIEELKKKAKSMIPGISRNDILLAPYPLPPLLEQNKIAGILTKLFSI